MSHGGQRHIIVPNAIYLKAKPDALAKTHFIGHNSPAKSHQVWPIRLSKPKYCGKKFQDFKLVLYMLWLQIPPIP